jgi:hypothetical protein
LYFCAGSLRLQSRETDSVCTSEREWEIGSGGGDIIDVFFSGADHSVFSVL